MSDERLRELERRWKRHRRQEDGVEWARELLRQGVVAGYMVRFADMWAPGSRWRLWRQIEYRQHLVVKFAGDSPTLTEVRAVRQLDRTYGALPAREALAHLRGLAQLDLGEDSGLIVRRLYEHAKVLGLDAVLEDRSRTEILPIGEGEDEPRRFCDPGIEEEIVLRMLASGIEVTQEVIVD